MKRREFLKVAGFSVLLLSPIKMAKGKEIESFYPVLVYDEGRCIGCKACMAACQLEHGLNEAPEINLFFIKEKEVKGNFPKLKFNRENACRHCREHFCVSACNYDAVRVEKGGVVTIDGNRCVGCGNCALACPYGAITLVDGKAKKCDLCAERVVKEGDVPRCVAVCPSGALIFGNLLKPEGALKELLESSSELRKKLSYFHSINVSIPIEKNVYDMPKTKKDNGRVVNTVCLACNARCGLRVTVKENKLRRIDGNPYHPYNRSGKEISYEIPVDRSFNYSASTCAKPQMDNDYLYNPYRVTQPLKRIGKRGEGKFKPISWEQLIKEVSEGGYLFKELGDNRYYPGIRDVLSDELIDPNAPELGTVRNQLVWFIGRSQAGRSHFIKRWLYSSIGTVNYISHTDICGIGFRMGNYAFSNGKEVEFKADYWNSKYMLIFGSNLYSAQQPGVNTSGGIIARRINAGELKVVIVDPRAPKAVAHAHKWLPVRPTKDGALAMGIIRVMLENGWFDKDFLSIPSLKTARKHGRNVYTNATHLIITEGKKKGEFLRIGGKPTVYDAAKGKVVPYTSAEKGEIEWEGEVNGIKVKTAFKLMKESVFEHSLSFYAKESGISENIIREVAKEFWEYAPYSVAFAYHGGGNYVGGTYASYAIAMLNALVGNVCRKGGYLGKGRGAADWQKGLYDLKNFEGKVKPRGIKISREKFAYENTSEFKKRGYPSKLPWFPFTKGGLSVAAISGIDQQYPYPIKVLIAYFSDFIYSMPGGIRFVETLKNHDKIPLFISIDTTINETNIYADYIVPDVTYLEGHYGFLTPHAPAGYFTAVRTPVVEPLVGRTKEGNPYSMETFIIDVSRYLKLPGYGDKAIIGRNGKLYPLKKAEDYYLRGIANLAFNAGVKSATKDEIKEVEKNYPVAKYRNILSEEEWKKVCTVLLKGGVFKSDEVLFDENGNFKSKVKEICIWNEKLGTSTDSLSGKKLWGTLKYVRATDYSGNPVDEPQGEFCFNLISYKSALHTQSRTVCYKQALVYEPDFSLKIHPTDAAALDLKDGDKVRITSLSNKKGFVTTVKVTELVRPGVVAYSHHFGHWQHGASSFYVENGESALLGGDKVVKNGCVIPDGKRRVGIPVNALTYLDSGFYNLPLLETFSGIPDFSSTKVKIEKL